MIQTCLDTQNRSAKPNTNNGKLRIALFNNPVSLDPDTFVEEVTENGKSFSVAVMDGNGSAKANFQSSMLFVLDVDNEEKGKPLPLAEQARLDDVVNTFEFMGIPPFLAYHTFSHSKSCHKFRLVWKLRTPIRDAFLYHFIARLLIEYFTLNYDKRSLDAKASLQEHMFFFGSNHGAQYYQSEHDLNVNTLFLRTIELKTLYEQSINPTTANRTIKQFTSSLKLSGYELYNLPFSSKNPDNVRCFHSLDDNICSKIEPSNIYILEDPFLIQKNESRMDTTFVLSKFHNSFILFSFISSKENHTDYTTKHLPLSAQTDRNRLNVESIRAHYQPVLVEEKLEISILKKLQQECAVLKAFCSKEALSHNDRFILLSFLQHFTNGFKLYRQYLKCFAKAEDTNIKSLLRKHYRTASCSTMGTACNKPHNLYAMYMKFKQEKVLKQERLRVPVDALRQDMQQAIRHTLDNFDHKIHLFKIDTGIGKTAFIHDVIHQYDNFIVAFSLHSKKEEFRNQCDDDIFIQQPLPDFLLPLHKEHIQQLNFQQESYISYIREIACPDHYSVAEKIQLRNYCKQYTDIYNHHKIYATHAKTPFILDAVPVDRVIYDETPEKLLLGNHIAVNNDIHRLLQVLKAKQPTPTITKLIAFYDAILFNNQYDTVHTLSEKLPVNFATILSEDDFEQLQLNSPVLELVTASLYIKSAKHETVEFISRFDLAEDKQILILSATPDIELYKALYGDRVVVHEFDKPVMQGKIYQLLDKSYSKYHLLSHKEALKHVAEMMDDYPFTNLITFKRYLGTLHDSYGIDAERLHNFGGIEGLNTMSGKNLLVAGSYNPPPNYIKIMAKALYDIDLNDIHQTGHMKHQLVSYDGVSFQYYSYTNEYARKIHLHFVWNELTQAIGRARVVNHACSVLVLSNFALYDADVIEESKLASLIQDIPETMELKSNYVDTMDGSTFAALFEEPMLYGLFQLEGSTTNNTSQVWSNDSDTSDKDSHEEAGALLEDRSN